MRIGWSKREMSFQIDDRNSFLFPLEKFNHHASYLSILLLLVFQAVWSPRDSFQPRAFDLASAQSAGAVGAVLDSAQRIAHLFQRVRQQGPFLERFRRALRGGCLVNRIPDFSFSRNA